nr:MAG TPA: hypothetical protein [Bacteriophage sp.]
MIWLILDSERLSHLMIRFSIEFTSLSFDKEIITQKGMVR